MRTITYKNYFDKVFGCWMGKSISGTIGAPFEGRKELFDYRYDAASIKTMLPNDDLDLQVLWLEVMEKKGIYFRTEDLADAFLHQCPYAPGEYQVFKKNYAHGIRPPYSGTFNNPYYIDGMGCPIRSEIWACICPGDPILAESYARKDGVMDHGNESVYAEAFLAAMEAEAFFENDLDKLLAVGLAAVPKESKFYRLVTDILAWVASGKDWRYIRALLLQNYGHPDCTNMYQNMGITILALAYCKGDLLETTMLALNCGFDTDCTCATVGALLGIIQGAEAMMQTYGFTDTGYVLGVDAPRRSDRLYDLAEDTCRVGVIVVRELCKDVAITDCPALTPVPTVRYESNVDIAAEYLGIPSVGIGETAAVNLRLRNNLNRSVCGKLTIAAPTGWIVSGQTDIYLAASESTCKTFTFTVPADMNRLNETNLITVTLVEGAVALETYTFGIAGAAVWKMYGPFWENVVQLPPMNYWDSYFAAAGGDTPTENMDILREYQLSWIAPVHSEYMNEPALTRNDGGGDSPLYEGKIVNTHTDRFLMEDVTAMQGPCAVYLERLLYSPEAREAGVQIGYSDACKLWVNGELLCVNTASDWCTNENSHVIGFPLQKGINRIVFKLARGGGSAAYSLVFSQNGATCAPHYTDFASVIE